MLDRTAKERGLKAGPVTLIAQIHDELLFEVDPRVISLPAAALLVKEAMEQVMQLAVPLLVNIKSGERWGEMKALEI